MRNNTSPTRRTVTAIRRKVQHYRYQIRKRKKPLTAFFVGMFIIAKVVFILSNPEWLPNLVAFAITISTPVVLKLVEKRLERRLLK